MTSISKTNENGYTTPGFCALFIKRFGVNRLLRQVNATKEKGVSAYTLFAYLVGLVFSGKNLYTVLELCHEKIGFGKDTVYRFLNKSAAHWEKFILRLSCAVVPEVDKLTADDRKSVLIIDR